MLMYIFNTEVFWYIKIIASTLVGILTVGGAFRAFTCDTFFNDYKIQEGRKRLIQGSTLCLIGFLICYGWTVLRSNGYFKHFDEETFGTPAYIIENREREKELSKLKIEEIKQKEIEKEKQKEEKRKQKLTDEKSKSETK